MHLTRYSIELMLADDRFHEAITHYEAEFKSGNRSALMSAIWLCGVFQAVMPDWLVLGIADTETKLSEGQYKDFNEAFGFENVAENQRTRKKKAGIKRNQDAVLAAFYEMRIQGEAFDQDTIDTIAGNIGISPRQVKNVLEEFKDQIAKIPRGPLPENTHLGLINSKIPIFKRVGREPLRKGGEKDYCPLREPAPDQ